MSSQTKMHLAVDKPGVFGGTMHTTLCNRLSDASDDMNRTDVETEVSCKLCLRRMRWFPIAHPAS